MDGPDQLELPSEVLMALRSLIHRHSSAHCHLHPNDNHHDEPSQQIPFVTKPMLHQALRSNSKNSIASANASTGVHVEIDRLCRTNELRCIRLHGTGDGGDEDVAVMHAADYLCGVWESVRNHVQMKQRSQRNGKWNARRTVQWFVDSLPLWSTRLYVTNDEMVRALPPSCELTNVVDQLMALQLLLPRTTCTTSLSASSLSSSYWFTLPGMGRAAKLLEKGRREMVSKLKRLTNQEARRSVLEEGKVMVSSRNGFSGAFLVRDLLARGVVRVQHRPSGQFIQLV